jgi:integrase
MYRQPGRKTWQVDVADDRGKVRKGCSTGCEDKRAAKDVEAMLERFRRRREWEPLRAITDRRATLAEVYDADVRGTLAALLDTRAAVDLDPLVGEWAKAGARASAVTEVRRFIPAGRRFPASDFRRGVISAWLAALTSARAPATPGSADGTIAAKDAAPLSGATRNRYKAALSAFAQFLVEREVLETNPVRDVAAYAESDPRMVFLSPTQAQALVRAFPAGEPQMLAALLANGIEWGALERATRRELTLDAVPPVLHAFPLDAQAKGKTKWRSRAVELTEAWTVPYVRAHAETLPAHARLATMTDRQLLVLQTRLCKTLGLPGQRLHDWRHTYAVTALARGDDHARIRNQLGHSPRSVLLYTVYGARRYQAAGLPAREAPPTPVEVGA